MTVMGRSRPAPASAHTDYFESLQRGDEPFYLGNAWYTESDPASSTCGANEVAALVNVDPAGATFGGAAGVRFVYTKFFPANVYRPAIVAASLTRGLFVQFEIVAIGTGATSCDVALMIGNPNRWEGYWLDIAAASMPVPLLGNLTNSPNYVYLDPAAIASRAAGDIIRMEVNFYPSVNVIRAYKNGLLQSTYNDARPQRPLSGSYGIFFHSCSGTFATVTVKDFSGGVL